VFHDLESQVKAAANAQDVALLESALAAVQAAEARMDVVAQALEAAPSGNRDGAYHLCRVSIGNRREHLQLLRSKALKALDEAHAKLSRAVGL
jgi:hypothetical protein